MNSISVIFVLVCLSLASSAVLKPQTRLNGGKATTPGQFRYIVSLQKINSAGGYDHYCAGTIANTKQIITAAHCVVDPGMTLNATGFRVVAGAYDIGKQEATQQIVAVANAVANPKYDKTLAASGNDIGVINLATELVFGEAVQAVALNNNTINANENCVNSGWGNTFAVTSIYTKISQQLQSMETKLVPDADCFLKYIFNVPSGGLDGTVCSKYAGLIPIFGMGHGTCQGDSGGPLVCYKNNTPYLVGAVSWGLNFCGSGVFPDVHSSISKLSEYLKTVLISSQ